MADGSNMTWEEWFDPEWCFNEWESLQGDCVMWLQRSRRRILVDFLNDSFGSFVEAVVWFVSRGLRAQEARLVDKVIYLFENDNSHLGNKWWRYYSERMALLVDDEPRRKRQRTLVDVSSTYASSVLQNASTSVRTPPLVSVTHGHCDGQCDAHAVQCDDNLCGWSRM